MSDLSPSYSLWEPHRRPKPRTCCIGTFPDRPLVEHGQLDSGHLYHSYGHGGSVINNGGTATITSRQYATDGSSSSGYGNGYVYIGGSSDFHGIGSNGRNGYVTMSGGVLRHRPRRIHAGSSWRRPGSGIFTQSGGVNIPYMNGTRTK